MSNNKDPRRLPVYVDRVNGRLLAAAQTGGPWFVISAGGGGGGSSPPASLSQPGIVQLEDSVTSTSIEKAATPNSVRQAFALAETANSLASGASINATTALNNSQSAVSTANAISGTANQANANASTALSTANAAQTAATNAVNAVDSKLDKAGGTVTGDVVFGHSARLVFEGAINDAFETFIAVEEPTGDRTITLPNATGKVPLLETANTWTGIQTFSSNVSFPNASCSGQLFLAPGGSLVFEGSSDDAFETFIGTVNATADREILFPNASGTVALTEGLAVVATSGSYNDLSNRPSLGTAAPLNVAGSGNATAGQVVKGDDTRLSTNLSYDAATRTLASSTGSGATLPVITSTTPGLAPASGGGSANFLRADGTWAVPPGVEGTDGDRGDIIVSGGGASWTIKNGTVSYAKIQSLSVGNRLLGKAGSTPGPIEEIPCSQAGRDIIAAPDYASQRSVLGLGALAQQDSLGFITSTGTIGILAGQPIITTTGGVLTTGSFGSSAGTFCEGNDARLSDKRATQNVLTFSNAGTGAGSGTTFDGSASRTISFNSIGAAAETHTHGNISSGGAIGSTQGLPIVTGVNGVLTTGAFGTASGTFCQGNDARLSDSRTTQGALTFDNTGTGATSGTTFNGSAARTISWNTIGAAQATHVHGQITSGGAIGTLSGLPIITGSGGVLQAGSFGTTAGTFCAGDDSRLSNTRNTTNSLILSNTGNGSTSGTTFNGGSAVTISYNSIGAQQALGFTPVQQGGGNGQGANKIYIGWNNNDRLRVQVDLDDYGTNWPINVVGNAGSVTNGVYTTGNQAVGGVKTFTDPIRASDGSANLPAISFNSAQGTGFYRADGFINFALGGSRRATFGNGDYYFSDNVSIDSGVNIGNSGLVRIGNRNQAAGWGFVQFLRTGVTIGSISQDGTTGVLYNTTSDYRLKENVRPIENATSKCKALSPCEFNFKSEPDRLVSGFIAHELQAVLPEAVSGEKDGSVPIGDVTDANGAIVQEGVPEPDSLDEGFSWIATGERPVYQGVDQSKVVPLLVATLQEAIARIEQLEALVKT